MSRVIYVEEHDLVVKYINETLEDKINRRLDEANQATKLARQAAKKLEDYETKRARRLRKIEKGWIAYRSKT